MNQSTRPDGMPPGFQPGMKFSAGDALMLAAAAAFAWWVQARNGLWLSKVVGFVVGNFFLFCNLFRLSRSLELLWTAVFLILAAVRLRTGLIEWSTIYWTTGALTALLVVVEMRKASYHGVGWKTINPGLREWWLKQKAGGSVLEAQHLNAGE